MQVELRHILEEKCRDSLPTGFTEQASALDDMVAVVKETVAHALERGSDLSPIRAQSEPNPSPI